MILSEFNLYGSLIQDDRFTLDNSVFTLFNTEYNHQFAFNRTPRRCTKKVYRNVTLVGNNKLTKNLNVYKLSEDLPHLYEVVVTYGDAVLKTIINEKVWSFFTKQPHNKINFKIMTKDWVTQLKIKILNRDDSEFFYVIIYIFNNIL